MKTKGIVVLNLSELLRLDYTFNSDLTQ